MFISALKREQELVEVRQAKYIAGDQPAKRKTAKGNEQAKMNPIRITYIVPDWNS